LLKAIPGIHHVTAIAGDPQQNIDFYSSFLGLRLVKLTVNYDDPETYHLYYGDEDGHPGTILTFFPWPGAPAGRKGVGQATTTSFSIQRESLGFWMERLKGHRVPFDGPTERFDEQLTPSQTRTV
jgi:glyoxalase family protein